ncbi:glycoside hydrolase family 55 protein [Athelia psychrophila]|uniref:Glycoside hydrolase family 55 protein n=1 Tax=Athelia psychrophila TaxID=1759441 RepID=A0A166EZU9_9AGAM|nr:glycoside hydrolase family 55 protein [Fibularhizoctonia sp. CBS 109695]
MHFNSFVVALSAALGSLTAVAGLGSSCTAALGAGTAAAGAPYWLQTITHQGIAPFSPAGASYEVFRNVKDFGAKGDGVTDDTAAINSAISSGSRCGGGSCSSSTVTPAVIYFPAGTYVVSAPIIAYYSSQLIGDARTPPTLKATAGFAGIAVIDADVYEAGGAEWYTNQDNFFRSVRNFVIDITAVSSGGTGLHWQVSQATSLINVVVNMSTASGTTQQGMFMENGSGGFMGDLVFNGGKYGIWTGNQQFTVRNITVNHAQTAIFADWNWGWTFQGVTINNCAVGFALANGGTTEANQGFESETIVDAVVTNTPIFVQTSTASTSTLSGSIVLSNIKLTNVPIAVGVAGGATVLAGGTTTISSWAQGDIYTGTSGNKKYQQGTVTAPKKASSLLNSNGFIVGKTHPQYAAYAVSQIASARSAGAKGDGKTDDTAAIKAFIAKYAGCKILFFDAGVYLVTDTIAIPAGTQVVGEAWSVIMASGSSFNSQSSPKVVIQAGAASSTGLLEISDMIFKTQGPTAGAIILEWNVHDPSGNQAAAGLWDSHIILGGAVGTNLQSNNCPSGSDSSACMAAFLGIHITAGASAYFEGTWVWLADHDLDSSSSGQLTLFSGRGLLSQSAGPVWLIGTSVEHHTLYQYNLQGAANHWIGFAQTETPYYQPVPALPTPFSLSTTYKDPSYPASNPMAWGINIASSTGIVIFGGGFYNFFDNYSQTCLTTNTCQNQLVNVDAGSGAQFYGVSTIGATYQLGVAQTGVIHSSDGANGFAETFTYWANAG